MDPRSELDQIRQRADNATTGPWDAVERASVYIPFHWGAVKAHVETDANAEFIAAARSDVPRLVAALTAVFDLHNRDSDHDCVACGVDAYGEGVPWPCPTVAAITDHLTNGHDR